MNDKPKDSVWEDLGYILAFVIAPLIMSGFAGLIFGLFIEAATHRK